MRRSVVIEKVINKRSNSIDGDFTFASNYEFMDRLIIEIIIFILNYKIKCLRVSIIGAISVADVLVC